MGAQISQALLATACFLPVAPQPSEAHHHLPQQTHSPFHQPRNVHRDARCSLGPVALLPAMGLLKVKVKVHHQVNCGPLHTFFPLRNTACVCAVSHWDLLVLYGHYACIWDGHTHIGRGTRGCVVPGAGEAPVVLSHRSISIRICGYVSTW